jgi:hypothetical protein
MIARVIARAQRRRPRRVVVELLRARDPDAKKHQRKK